jgi:hypothetical protein
MAVLMNVIAGTMTSLRFPFLSIRPARCKADVHELVASAHPPRFIVNICSKAWQRDPYPHHRDSMHSLTESAKPRGTEGLKTGIMIFNFLEALH